MAYLKDLLKNVTYMCMQGSVDCRIESIAQNSRQVQRHGMFICIKGVREDGHNYITEAIGNGACVCVVEHNVVFEEQKMRGAVTIIRVRSTKRALAEIAAAFYGYPARAMRLVGITGTKGKTTTAYMLYQMMIRAGISTGLIGTLGMQYQNVTYQLEVHRTNSNTTPDALLLQQQLREMADSGCSDCIMEVSSQGLKNHRVEGIVFDAGVFTNLSEDHIGTGEHKNFREYAACKKKLFHQSRCCIVNADDAYADYMISQNRCQKISYGIKARAAYQAVEVSYCREQTGLGMSYWLRRNVRGSRGTEDMEQMKLFMPGVANVYNSLAATAAAEYLGISSEVIREVLRSVKVRGRIEEVSTPLAIDIIIDYAHNAVSLKQLLDTLRAYEPKRLVVLFGCGGNRSKLRRYQMGEVAGRMADYVIITSDNPRFEDPEAIIADIKIGIEKTKGSYQAITDRREAIAYAIKNARPGDMIVLAGKGHEAYQEIEGQFYPMDEKQMIQESIRGE